MENKTPVASHELNVVPCMEVSVSKEAIENFGHNLLWTLSVYSLDNQPVKNLSGHGEATSYHFMVYDWKRTIQQLLAENSIPYYVVQYFALDTLYRPSKKKVSIAKKDADILFGANVATPETRYELKTHFAEPVG
jgi:hypothetical protein